MHKKKLTGDKRKVRLKKIESRSRKHKGRMDLFSTRLARLSDRLDKLDTAANTIASSVMKAEDVRSGSAENEAVLKGLSEQVGALQVGLRKLTARMDTIEQGKPAGEKGKRLAAGLGAVETRLQHLGKNLAEVTNNVARLTPRIDASERTTEQLETKIQVQEKQSSSFYNVQENIEGQVRQLKLLIDELKGKYEDLERKSSEHSVAAMSRIDSVRNLDREFDAKLTDFDIKLRKVDTLVQSLITDFSRQETGFDEVKSSLVNLSQTAAKTNDRLKQLETRERNHGISLASLKMEVGRQASLQDEFDEIKERAARDGEQINHISKGQDALQRRAEVLETETQGYTSILAELGSRIRSRFLIATLLSVIGIGAIGFLYFHIGNKLRLTTDTLLVRMGALEQRIDARSADEDELRSMGLELESLRVEMTRLKQQKAEGPQSKDVAAMQRQIGEMVGELTIMRGRLETGLRQLADLPGRSRVAKGPAAAAQRLSPGAMLPAGKVPAETPARAKRGRYTIQLIGSYHKRLVTAFQQQHGLTADTRVEQTERKGRPWFVLLYGSYPHLSTAVRALRALPASLQENQPWVRRPPR